MRILFALPRFHNNQQCWSNTLRKHGHEVTYLVAEKHPKLEDYSQFDPIVAPQRALRFPWRLLYRLYMQLTLGKVHTNLLRRPKLPALQALIEQHDPEVVVVREASSALSLATTKICRRLGIPVILYSQYPVEASDSWRLRLLRRLGRAPELRFSPTRLTRSTEHNPATNAFYVPFATNFAASEHKSYAPDGIVRLLMVAKFISKRKNHRLLIEALAALDPVLSWHLTLVGSGAEDAPTYFASLEQAIAAHNLSDRVHIHNNVSFSAMANYYQQADVFVLPSANEPFAISPLEAMNYQLPVIITDTNGATHCIEPDVTGHIVPTGDVTALANSLETLISDPTKIAAMGQAAYAYHQKNHTPDAFYERFMNVVTAATTS